MSPLWLGVAVTAIRTDIKSPGSRAWVFTGPLLGTHWVEGENRGRKFRLLVSVIGICQNSHCNYSILFLDFIHLFIFLLFYWTITLVCTFFVFCQWCSSTLDLKLGGRAQLDWQLTYQLVNPLPACTTRGKIGIKRFTLRSFLPYMFIVHWASDSQITHQNRMFQNYIYWHPFTSFVPVLR